MKRILVLLCAVAMLLSLSACGGRQTAPDREIAPITTVAPEETEAPAAETDEAAVVEETSDANAEKPESVKETMAPTPTPAPSMPTATSSDAELYSVKENSGASYVVNKYGELAGEYKVDENGNIAKKDGMIVVAAPNVEEFEAIRSLSFAKNEYNVTLDARDVPVDNDPNITRTVQYAVTQQIKLDVKSPTATNQVVIIESTNPDVVEIRANQNAKIIFDGDLELAEGQLAIAPEDPAKPITITVVAKVAGDAKILANALSGTAAADCELHVFNDSVDSIPVPTPIPNEFVNASGNSTLHVHHYVQTVIPPTPWEKGYTLYTCSECGYSYQDNFTSKLPAPEPVATPHIHSYTSSIVAPTATERGYTLYVCNECGDSYRANYVDPVGQP